MTAQCVVVNGGSPQTTGRIRSSELPEDLSDAVLVLTAGSTSSGAIDSLALVGAGEAAWTHVDAAWAGPLVLSRQHGKRLAGIGQADSVRAAPLPPLLAARMPSNISRCVLCRSAFRRTSGCSSRRRPGWCCSGSPRPPTRPSASAGPTLPCRTLGYLDRRAHVLR